MSVVKRGQWIYYQDYFGFKQLGKVLIVRDNGEFSVSSNPNTSMPQMDDSYRALKPSDEGKYFWLHPTPEHPIPIEIQQEMQRRNK